MYNNDCLCLASSGSRCWVGSAVMGPHADDCLQTLWDFWCNPEAGGSPSQSVLFVEGWNTMTINAVYHQISNLNDRALVGSQPALTQCYGQSK